MQECRTEFDYVFVGGGFSGLSSAMQLKLLDSSLKVAVVEKSKCGYGASSRNSGIIHSPLFYSDSAIASKFVNAQKDFKLTFKNSGVDTEGWVYGTDSEINSKKRDLDRLGAPWRELSEKEIERITAHSDYLSQKNFLAVPEFIVDPISVLSTLVNKCYELDVDIITDKTVIDIKQSGSKACGVVCSDGYSINSATIILTSGQGTYSLMETIGSKFLSAIRTRTQTMIAVSGLDFITDSKNIRIALQPANMNGMGVVPARDGMSLVGLDYRPPTVNCKDGIVISIPEVDDHAVHETLDKLTDVFPQWNSKKSHVSIWPGVKTDFIGFGSDYRENIYDDNPDPITVDHGKIDGIFNLYTLFCGKMTLFMEASSELIRYLGYEKNERFVFNSDEWRGNLDVVQSPVTKYNLQNPSEPTATA